MTTKDLTHRQINSFKMPKELEVQNPNLINPFREATRIARAELSFEPRNQNQTPCQFDKILTF